VECAFQWRQRTKRMNNGNHSEIELDTIIEKIISGEPVSHEIQTIVFASILKENRETTKIALATALECKKLLYGASLVFSAVLYLIKNGWLIFPI